MSAVFGIDRVPKLVLLCKWSYAYNVYIAEATERDLKFLSQLAFENLFRGKCVLQQKRGTNLCVSCRQYLFGAFAELRQLCVKSFAAQDMAAMFEAVTRCQEHIWGFQYNMADVLNTLTKSHNLRYAKGNPTDNNLTCVWPT